MHYVHDLSPFLWQFSENFGIRWYGLAYAVGLIWGWLTLIWMAKAGRLQLDAKGRSQFILALLLGIIIGGRLGFMLLYDSGRFFSNPLTFFEFWKGGMASHGGMIGVGIATFIFAHINKINFWRLIDATVLIAPMGLMLGRIANFINGELWGRISDVKWAVIFPKSAPEGTPVDLIAPRHPSQLYEAAGEGLLLLIYTQLRYWLNPKLSAGKLSAEFLVIYAIVRIVCEGFRQPDADLIMGLSRGIFYSIFMIPVGIGLWLWSNSRKEKTSTSAQGDR